MMISVKKGFISSNSRIICLPCPLSCGHFFIQESAVGGLSYYTKKSRDRADFLSVMARFTVIYQNKSISSNIVVGYGSVCADLPRNSRQPRI